MDDKQKIPSDMPLPDHSVEWHEGWKAFDDGKELKDNPYMADKQAKEYMRWQRGWEAHNYQNAKA